MSDFTWLNSWGRFQDGLNLILLSTCEVCRFLCLLPVGYGWWVPFPHAFNKLVMHCIFLHQFDCWMPVNACLQTFRTVDLHPTLHTALQLHGKTLFCTTASGFGKMQVTLLASCTPYFAKYISCLWTSPNGRQYTAWSTACIIEWPIEVLTIFCLTCSNVCLTLCSI